MHRQFTMFILKLLSYFYVNKNLKKEKRSISKIKYMFFHLDNNLSNISIYLAFSNRFYLEPILKLLCRRIAGHGRNQRSSYIQRNPRLPIFLNDALARPSHSNYRLVSPTGPTSCFAARRNRYRR